jgi:hypothetical protein
VQREKIGGVAKKIVYGDHVQEKFALLRRHGFVVSRRQVRETFRNQRRSKQGIEGEK